VSTVLGGSVRPGGSAGGAVALPDTGSRSDAKSGSWYILVLGALVLAGGALAGVAAYQQRRR
jgi:hypothetical protein